jgi:cholestenol delta-isomerase
MCWWAFTGLTHIVIEGTFVFNPGFFRKENPNYFDEVCKFSLRNLPSLYHHVVCRIGA